MLFTSCEVRELTNLGEPIRSFQHKVLITHSKSESPPLRTSASVLVELPAEMVDTQE